MKKLRVLYATSEAYPLVKTGGLGDVSHALPTALRRLDIDIRILIPGYPQVLEKLSLVEVYENLNLFNYSVNILAGTMPDGITPIYVVDCPALYLRDGGPYQNPEGYDWHDNALRFGVLSKVAALFGNHDLLFKPDVIHCNDWQTGLTAAFLAYSTAPRARTLMSIHNVAYQGIFGAEMVGLLGLPPESFNMLGLEFYGMMSFLKAGLYYSDWINTVSPNYAREIQTPAFGHGLDGLLALRHDHLTGILNGVDIDFWNPEADRYIFAPYNKSNLVGKRKNAQALRKKLGLSLTKADRSPTGYKPLLGVVSRLTSQKGLDLFIPIIPEIVNSDEGAQVAILGSGDHELEARLQQLAELLPGKVSVTFGYDEELAHQIEAGADIFIMPSRFEPCGLNQMYSMRYGTIPVVRRTGGLADTVIDATPENLEQQGLATGFVFEKEDSRELLQTIQRTLQAFRDKNIWRKLQQNCMGRDFSWESSAKQYISLYSKLIQK